MNRDLFLADLQISNLNFRPGRLGGKVWGLIQLKRCGFDVPTFVAISPSALKEKLWEKDKCFYDEIFAWVKQTQVVEGAKKFIVRSSSQLEDQKYSSCAGVFKSIVIENIADIFGAIEEVLLHAEREIEKRQNIYKLDIAVILQRYIEGKISGVCFSVEPLKANPQLGYGECVFGENKLLVDGSCIPTRFTFDFFPPRIVDLFPGDKAPVEIDPKILDSLVICVLSMEWVFKYPVDIEWTWDGEKVWFLQVRYVTSLRPDSSLLPQECSTSWFFNQRFVEPITPFTRTTLLPRVIKKAHLDALQMRGKVRDVKVDFFAGQVYIPHKVYIDILDACPKWWLSGDLKQLFPGNCPCGYQKRDIVGFSFWIDSFYQLFKNYKHSLFIMRSWKKWQEKANLILNSFATLDLSKLTTEEWLSLWNELELLNDEFFAIHRWAILWANYVYRLGGKYIANILRKYRAFPYSVTRISNMRLLKFISSKDENLREELITNYGHRCENLDYYSPRWAEMIDEMKEKLEVDVSDECKDWDKLGKEEKFSKSRLILGFIIPLLKFPIKFINLREEQRFEWEKVLYAQKRLVLEAGKRLVERGIIKKVEDVWFLTWDEFLNCFISVEVLTDDIVAQRKHEWCVYHGFNKPLFVGRRRQEKEPQAKSTILELKGIGVSYGKVRGVAHIMNSPDDLLPSIPRPRILVGHSLNPGQTWCLELWDGFVLETGSELSHPAILAREYEVPMITAVENVLSVLNEGDMIEVDCESGVVRIIKNRE